MTRLWQLLLLGAALFAPTGAWADKSDSQRGERWRSQEHVRDDNNRRWSGQQAWKDFADMYDYPRDSKSEKKWRKAQKEHDKARREAEKQREKDRRESRR